MAHYPGVNKLTLNLSTVTKIAEKIAYEEISPEVNTIGTAIYLKFKVDTEQQSFKEALIEYIPRGCRIIESSASLYSSEYEIKFTSDPEAPSDDQTL